MPILDSVPTVQAEDPQALIEEAKRHRRHRRWFTACVVALVVAVSLGVYAGISWSSGGGPSKGTPTAAARSLVGLPANNSAYRECPGSARVGPATSPDGLPAMTSRTNDLSFRCVCREEHGPWPLLGIHAPDRGTASPQRRQGHPCGTRRWIRLDARDLWSDRG